VSDRAETTNPIDPVTAGLIRRKADQLAHKVYPPHSDRDDIAQSLTIDLMERMSDFDPAQGDRETFVKMILANAAADILRRLRAKRIPTTSMPEEGLPDPKRSPNDLAGEVAEVLATLPEQLRRVVELLGTSTVVEIAERLGVARSTVYRHIGEIRTRFERAGFGES
jgi:RNA polymerase sigma factor (sigma-70 family)